jgi:8-oxo-dGTP pyrophosphatase MutT (NUDIX family)
VTQTSAGGVILDTEGKVVLTSRRSFRGEIQWGLPKGIVEKGEEPAAAAAREAREETGLEVELVGPLDVIDYWFVQPARGGEPAKRIHKFVHFFLMKAVGGDTSAHDFETEEVVILEPSEALARASFESEKKVIAMVVKDT